MSLRSPRVMVIALLAGASLALAANPVQTSRPTALIAGQVVDASTGRGLGETVVTLSMTSVPGTVPSSPAAREGSALKVITDSTGRFVFTALAKGRYTLTSSRPGYTPGSHGKLAPRGPSAPIDLADGERLMNVRILIWRHSVVTGRVVDEAGEPVVGVEVSALRRTSNAGRGGFGAGHAGITDDRGIYRLSSLEPGVYLVAVLSKSVTVPAATLDAYFRTSGSDQSELRAAILGVTNVIASPGSREIQQVGSQVLVLGQRAPTPPMQAGEDAVAMYPTTYFSQALRPAEASAVVLRGGESQAGIDFALRPVPGVRVSGTLEGPSGPVAYASIHLVTPSAANLVTDAASTVASAVADASGAFSFLGVPPGQYAIRVVKLPLSEPRPSVSAVVVQTPKGVTSRGIGTNPDVASTRPTYWAEQSVTVGERNLESVRVAMRTGFRVAGRIVFEPGSPTIPMQRLYPLIEATETWRRTMADEAITTADGSFSTPEVPGGLYRITLPLPAGWIVRSVVAGGRDLPDLPFELKEDLHDVVITVSNRGARLSGAIRDSNGAPNATAAVMLFPTDRRQWVNYSAYARGLKEVIASRDGSYTIPDLVAGEFFVIALPQPAVDWSDPQFLERLSRLAVRVTISDGEERALDLRTWQVR